MIPTRAEPDPLAKLIREQAEVRLDAQQAFANAQDVRAVALLSAGATLAAGAAAVAGSALTSSSPHAAVAGGAVVAVIGFTLAAALALGALKSATFEARGYHPSDFADDQARPFADVEAEVVTALDQRLKNNAETLKARGEAFNRAAVGLLATPAVAVVVAVIVGLRS